FAFSFGCSESYDCSCCCRASSRLRFSGGGYGDHDGTPVDKQAASLSRRQGTHSPHAACTRLVSTASCDRSLWSLCRFRITCTHLQRYVVWCRWSLSVCNFCCSHYC